MLTIIPRNELLQRTDKKKCKTSIHVIVHTDWSQLLLKMTNTLFSGSSCQARRCGPKRTQGDVLLANGSHFYMRYT